MTLNGPAQNPYPRETNSRRRSRGVDTLGSSRAEKGSQEWGKTQRRHWGHCTPCIQRTYSKVTRKISIKPLPSSWARSSVCPRLPPADQLNAAQISLSRSAFQGKTNSSFVNIQAVFPLFIPALMKLYERKKDAAQSSRAYLGFLYSRFPDDSMI